jgi:hypothetical protein
MRSVGLAVVGVLLGASVAAAAPFSTTFGPVSTSEAGPFTVSATLDNLPTAITSDLTIDLSVIGDLNRMGTESISVMLDDFSLGTICNMSSGDDAFDIPGGANGDDCASGINLFSTGLASIALDDIESELADGELIVSFAGSEHIQLSSDYVSGEVLRSGVLFDEEELGSFSFAAGGTISYEADDFTPPLDPAEPVEVVDAPLPASLPMLLGAIGLLAALRRRGRA